MSLSARLRAAGLDPRLAGLGAALAVLWLVLDRATGGLFLTPRNLYNLAVQTSAVGIMATGMVLVIVARHIDLSVGSVLGFTGMAVAVLQAEVFPADAPWGWPLALLCGLVLGAAIGAWQGWWTAYRGVPSFVVTLGGLLVFRGGAWLLTDGRTVAPLSATYQLLGGGLRGSLGAGWSRALVAGAVGALALSAWRARRRRRRHDAPVRPWPGELALLGLRGGALVAFVEVMNAATLPRSEVARGIPAPVLLLGGVALVVGGLARATRFGRHVFAMGGSPEAARRAGVDVRRVTLATFVLMGVLAALAGVLTTARLGAGTNSMGTLAELSVIAAAVIGGTSLAGGVGSVAGALLGAVLMQSLDNGLVLLGVSSPLRQVWIGLALIAAVWIDGVARRSARAEAA